MLDIDYINQEISPIMEENTEKQVILLFSCHYTAQNCIKNAN